MPLMGPEELLTPILEGAFTARCYRYGNSLERLYADITSCSQQLLSMHSIGSVARGMQRVEWWSLFHGLSFFLVDPASPKSLLELPVINQRYSRAQISVPLHVSVPGAFAYSVYRIRCFRICQTNPT